MNPFRFCFAFHAKKATLQNVYGHVTLTIHGAFGMYLMGETGSFHPWRLFTGQHYFVFTNGRTTVMPPDCARTIYRPHGEAEAFHLNVHVPC